MVTRLSATKFKPLKFSMLGFALPYIVDANEVFMFTL
jgi:hypothetical protein